MNTLLLEPTDVLFFRDGRPMTGSLSGHSAAWPLPNVVDHALHAALHRSGLESHSHRFGRNGRAEKTDRTFQFGSLVTAGPFPVCCDGAKPEWFFPRPADAMNDANGLIAISRHPVELPGGSGSSLPDGLRYAVADNRPASKDLPAPWWSTRAWDAYLGGVGETTKADFVDDSAIAAQEHQIGIAIDPESGATISGKFYSAHYLRLRRNWQMGLFTEAPDKLHAGADLVRKLVSADGHLIVGGQQRLCTVRIEPSADGEPLPLPRGCEADFPVSPDGRSLVKWTLLTPAIWPKIAANSEKQVSEHPGGWLPNWIARQRDGLAVQLKADDLPREGSESRAVWRQRVAAQPAIEARLVAAVVPKPVVVTGWFSSDREGNANSAKPTHLAVPAGAVYYFEAKDPVAAKALARALNWHGATSGTDIVNRRSTLLGEKGFGLGVCSGWHFHPGPSRTSD